MTMPISRIAAPTRCRRSWIVARPPRPMRTAAMTPAVTHVTCSCGTLLTLSTCQDADDKFSRQRPDKLSAAGGFVLVARRAEPGPRIPGVLARERGLAQPERPERVDH